MQNILALLALAGGACATALPDTQKRADTQYEDTFDDLATTIAVPQLFPVGIYNGVSYGASVVLRPVDGIASVVPHSPPQHAGAAGPLDLLYLGELTLNTFTTLTRGDGVTSFDLQSFWFGFGTDTGTTAGLAQPGTLYAVGYDVDGNQLPVTSFSYVPDNTLNANLVFATLPDDFVNLQNVTFGVAQSQPISERTYIALDNVRHLNHA